MATKYRTSAQTGERGVAFVRKLVTDAGSIYRPFEATDLGIDAMVELITQDQEASGDFVLFQIKAGTSYIRGSHFYLDADKDHFETWARYSMPVIGIICDLSASEARWVDISEHLRKHPEVIANGPYSIKAPAVNSFSGNGFQTFVRIFRRRQLSATNVATTPNLLIREWQLADAKPTRVLLSSIAQDYPKFNDWLDKKFTDLTASKKVAVVDGVIAAFSMWQAKDERNIKLQTFIVGSAYRGSSIGQHLLYHELRTLERTTASERVYVTVASSKSDLIAYFRLFGFKVEGIAASRYPRPAAELVMTKHFVREVIRTTHDLQRIANRISEQYWGLKPSSPSRFNVTSEDLAIPAIYSELSMVVNTSDSTPKERISLEDTAGRRVLSHDDESLMREYYPLRLHLPRKCYVLIPIFQQWVEAMLSTSGEQTPLKLRVENVYYCYPKLSKLAKGDCVLFYEPKKENGRGAAIGSAVVQEVTIDVPSTLIKRYSKLGIYSLDDVKEHQNAAGKAMAIKFSLFEPFSSLVPLTDIRRHLGNATNIQGLSPIGRDPFEIIRTQGLA